MERLTRKDKKKGFYYIPNKCLRMAGDRYYGEDDGFFDMLKRLAEFEDFMEEQGFEDLGTFRTAIKLNQLMNKAGVEHFKENQALKVRWEKLKDFIVRELREAEKTGTECDDEYDYFYLVGTAVDFYKSLLKTMRELEENND